MNLRHMWVTYTPFVSMHGHFPKVIFGPSLMHQILVDLNQRLDIESMLHRNGISLQRNISTIEILEDLSQGQLKVLKDLTNDCNVEPFRKVPTKGQSISQALTHAVDDDYEKNSNKLKTKRQELALYNAWTSTLTTGGTGIDPAIRFFLKTAWDKFMEEEAMVHTIGPAKSQEQSKSRRSQDSSW